MLKKESELKNRSSYLEKLIEFKDTDFGQIAAMGVMSTPALVIDNKVVSMGKVLSKDEVIKALKKIRG